MHLLLDTSQSSQAIDTLLNQGVVGALCVLRIIGVVWIANALMASHKERIQDLTSYAAAIKGGNEAVHDLVLETSRATSSASSETLLSNREVITSVKQLEGQVQQLTQVVSALRDQQVRLEAALNSKGPR